MGDFILILNEKHCSVALYKEGQGAHTVGTPAWRPALLGVSSQAIDTVPMPTPCRHSAATCQ